MRNSDQALPGSRNWSSTGLPPGGIFAPRSPTLPLKTTGAPPIRAAAARMARVKHDYTSGELTAAEWRELE